MRRDPRLWFPLALACAGSAVIIGLLLLPKLGKGRPTEPVPHPPPETNVPDLPPWMKCEALAAGFLDAPGLCVFHPKDSAYCYVCAADAGTAIPDGLPPATEGYADCWRGVVLCGADWAAAHPDEAALPLGPHACLAGDFYLFGDPELMERVRPVAEQVHYGPWRGVGGPAPPPRDPQAIRADGPSSGDGRDAPPRTQFEWLAGRLREEATGLRVVRPDASAFCYVCDAEADADAAALAALPPEEEYADCWRGVVLCELDQPGLEGGPHSCRVGGFYLFGDVELLDRVRPVAEGIRSGLRGGAGGPAWPP